MRGGLAISDDGRFTVTIGPDPANGRPNHIQTSPNARYVFIRECRSDWRQVPAIHRVRRISPPSMPPLARSRIEERAAQFIVDDVCSMFWLTALMLSLEPNDVLIPMNAGSVGGLSTQRVSFARLVLNPDEVFVIDVRGRDAPFRDIVVHDFWFRTLDYWRRTSSFNNSQGRINPDGSTTYVVAMRDPGVHNWLDTAGLRQVLLVHRWQGLPFDLPAEEEPVISGRIVDRADLAPVLPDSHHWVTPVERKEQLNRRKEEFTFRYTV